MISQIYTSTRNILNSFSFNGAARGNNALVTVKDLQNVIQQINNQIFYRPVDFMLTHNNQANPTYKLLVSGATECGSSCNCSTNDCACNGPVSDPGACQKEASALIVSVTRFAVGVYHVNFKPGHPDLINRGVAIWPSALADVTHRIVATKIQNNVMTIATYNGAVLDDTILDQTVFSMKLYVTK